MSTLLRYMFLPLLVGFIIFIATCLIGAERVPDLSSSLPWDKIAHFGMFFLLSAVSLLDYYKLHDENPPAFRWIFWGLVIPVIYGGVIEILQKYFFTSRSAEMGDWIADILGSVTATLLAIILLQKRNVRRKNISL
jgi:VanZ family protein